jgi:ribosomal protein S18 acetylase RimI-like enzyme
LYDLKSLQIRHIDSRECVKGFGCGVAEIDKWVREKCWKFHQRHRARTFCAFGAGATSALGFYTLSFASEHAKKIMEGRDQERYSATAVVPLIYLDYIAVLQSMQCNGVGTMLLMNAIERSYYVSNNVPIFGLALRSLNEATSKLYQKYGFVPKESGSHPLMVLPILVDRGSNREEGVALHPLCAPAASPYVRKCCGFTPASLTVQFEWIDTRHHKM